LVFSEAWIWARRRAWRGLLEKGVDRKIWVKRIAASGVYMRAPRLRTLASLCWRASWAVSSVQATAARMPGSLFAAICSPLPEPPMTMPRLPGSLMTAWAAAIT
jgi:hypothetical protein